MEREAAVSCLRRLHEAQGAFYAGGSDARLRQLLTEDVVWRVPGKNSIAGVYPGVDAVMVYFARRRELANRTFKLHPGEVLVGAGELVAVLTDGTALIEGVEHRWSTVGLYCFRGQLVAGCRLVPLDPDEFDRIWSVTS